MTELTAQTTFTVAPAQELYVESVDLLLLPENAGSSALRELHYPADLLPPLIYEDNPDKWENFDTGPLTARPLTQSQQTLTGNQLARWAGYVGDRPVKEYWSGSDRESRMSAYQLRRLWEYFANPPASGYITWTPKDRVDQAFDIEIEGLQAGGQDLLQHNFLALNAGYVLGEVVFTFRIIGEHEEGS